MKCQRSIRTTKHALKNMFCAASPLKGREQCYVRIMHYSKGSHGRLSLDHIKAANEDVNHCGLAVRY